MLIMLKKNYIIIHAYKLFTFYFPPNVNLNIFSGTVNVQYAQRWKAPQERTRIYKESWIQNP